MPPGARYARHGGAVIAANAADTEVAFFRMNQLSTGISSGGAPGSRRAVALVAGLAGAVLLQGCGGGGGSRLPPTVPALDRIVYQSTVGGDAEIYVMNGDGSGQTALTNNSAFDADPKFNRDGSKIVFTSSRDGNQEIYLMDAAGQNPVNLSRNADSDSDPVVSPDGSKIAFVSDRARTGSSLPTELEIYLMNANGTSVKRLTTNTSFDGDPVFSPDGKKILFSSEQDGNQEIYEIDLDGKQPHNLTRSTGLDRFPNFTPDGNRIVFVSDRTGNAEIYAMDTNGANLVNLTQNPALDTDPVISPDGKRLIFTSARNGTLDIFSMPLDGSVAPIALTKVAGSERFPDVR